MSRKNFTVWWEWLKVYLPGTLLGVAAFALAWQYVEPAPPSTVRMALGPSESSYFWLGERYREVLLEQGLEVELLESKGSTENLEMIRDGRADIALVQSGVSLGKEEPYGFAFLASLFPEPLWVFTRDSAPRADLLGVEGKRLGIGPAGSGSFHLARAVLTGMGLAEQNELVESNEKALLEEGELDLLFLVASPNSPQLRELLEDDDLQLISFRRAAGVTKHFDSITHLTLEEGSVDLKGNLPGQKTELLASSATLVVGEGFHPALTGVVLGAATKIHGQPGALQERGEYPSPEHGSFPLTREADYFHQNGPGFLQGLLPYKAAATLERLVILLLPLLTVILPLAKILPALYAWRLNSRIHRPYKELLRLENQVGEPTFLQELQEVEKEARALADMPASYGAQVQNLRLHIERLRRSHHESIKSEP